MSTILTRPNRDWETTFKNWTSPSSDHENNRMENAEAMVRNALRSSNLLSLSDLDIILTGSYINNTNVRQQSDVDIMVCYNHTIYTELPFNYTNADFGWATSSYQFSQFKNDLLQTLKAYFGPLEVERGNKVLVVKDNTYHVGIDVCPCFPLEIYSVNNGIPSLSAPLGMKFLTDGGEAIQNWPVQHLSNGREKNNATGRKYKEVVRILKRLRNHMEDALIFEAIEIPPFLIECLAYNAPNFIFANIPYTQIVGTLLEYLWREISSGSHKNWTEVNGIKYLFHSNQKWTDIQAKNFVGSALKFIGS